MTPMAMTPLAQRPLRQRPGSSVSPGAVLGSVLALALCLAPSAVRAQCTITEIAAGDPAGEARFGRALAIAGDRLISGAIFDDEIDTRAGAAYVFLGDGMGGWTQEAKLLASDGANDDSFGRSVDLDGLLAIIGAPNDDDLGDRSGAAYVFLGDGLGGWSEEAKLIAPDGAPIQFFGTSVGISGDVAVIGAPQTNAGASNGGAAHVFRRDGGGAWSFEQKLVPGDPETEALFGNSIAIDGDFIIVGATTKDGNAVDSGAVYVFRHDGATWTEEAKLIASDATTAQAFGLGIDIEGSVAAVGAPFDNGNGSFSGAAYVYVRGGGGTWHEAARLESSTIRARDQFGSDVAIDGGNIAVGAYRVRVGNQQLGAAYYFAADGQGGWTELGKFIPDTIADNDNFGFALAMDAGNLVAGARLHEVGPTNNAGAAYVFAAAGPDCLCMPGNANSGAGATTDLLFINGTTGGPSRTVTTGSTELLVAYLLSPPAGGNGKFVVHANSGAPTAQTMTALPSSVGTSCFDFLLPTGAAPLAIWNNIGRRGQVGDSTGFDGASIPDPPRAPSIFVQLHGGDPINLPPGTTLTLQGAIIDPGASSSVGGSLSNAVVIVFE